ncbi:MAG: ClpXP protease specificity-enhancing factor SspB, partial [Dokdonella sp.]
MATDHVMSSNRPYLLRAMHEWINDNGMTPYMLVDANAPGVHVPPASV